MLPQCQKVTNKHNSGAVSGLSWSDAVKRQLSAFTVTCICGTVALLKRKKTKTKQNTGHTFSVRVPGNSVLVSYPNELARSGIKRAESWREWIAMTRIDGHHSHSAELERSLCSGTGLCLSAANRRIPSSKVPLIMKARMKFRTKVFCFSFSCLVKKKNIFPLASNL